MLFKVLLTTVLLCAAPVTHAFEVPPNDGFVTDAAGILDEAEEQQIEEVIQIFRDQTSNEIAVVIVNSLDGEPIVDAAIEIGRKWGVGTKENDNGIVLLVGYEDREMFLAVGYGLEGAVPDLAAKGVIEQDIVPQFRDGAYGVGIAKGVDSLIKLIGGEYTVERYENSKDGGGSYGWIIFFFLFLLEVVASFLARSKSWWLGGVLGAVFGIILTVIFGWWLSIPALAIVGLILDFIVSKNPPGSGKGGFWIGGGRSSGGGFGGFSGGSFGGGGAGGSW